MWHRDGGCFTTEDWVNDLVARHDVDQTSTAPVSFESLHLIEEHQAAQLEHEAFQIPGCESILYSDFVIDGNHVNARIEFDVPQLMLAPTLELISRLPGWITINF